MYLSTFLFVCQLSSNNPFIRSLESELVPVGEVNITCVDSATSEFTTFNVSCTETGQWSPQLQCCECNMQQYVNNDNIVRAVSN